MKKLENTIAKVVKSNSGAVVKIAEYDTLNKVASLQRFSGVVVDAEGHILTAAHATQPKQTYQIIFPDGKQVLAKGLGRISMGRPWPTIDLAMIQISTKGIWPFVKMGYSASLKNGEPCIGISYPATFEQSLPNVRLGRVSNSAFSFGNFESTCKMEPGDSGGPLFDAKGLLIGIHSWIKPDEQQNYEVPVDLFRKYWDDLLIPVTYQQLPSSKDSKYKPHNVPNDTIPSLGGLLALKDRQVKTVVRIKSILNGQPITILGTLLTCDIGERTVSGIISKSSMVGDSVIVFDNGRSFSGSVLKRDESNDLVWLADNVAGNEGFKMMKSGFSEKLLDNIVGKIMLSALWNGNSAIGIASTGYIETKMKYGIGYFGAGANFIDGRITITSIPKGSPSEKVVEMYDQIIAINGVPVDRPEHYGAELGKHHQNDSISIDVIRKGKKLHLGVRLGVYVPNSHMADQYPGGRSIRPDGFKQVFAYDAAVQATDCGSPVFDVGGNFIGINIARNSRTSTIVMPARVIRSFLENDKNL